ncbi:MAG: alpha/beta hydrolase-fold protein [Tenacibaculum sp.]|nr:alpha/beta hydrolase-fold protein [Tenacibaculum sp.]
MKKEKKIAFFIILIFGLFTINFAFAQQIREQNITKLHKVSSGSQNYLIKITFPPNYNSSKEYNVLYYLDAWFISDVVTGSYNVLNRCDYVENIVLIGISIEGNEYDFNKQRVMDFTPSKHKMSNKMKALGENGNYPVIKSGAGNNAVLVNSETTGGADIFINFLSGKLFPFVEKKYPNLNNRKGFLGHSLGGLFGAYLLQKKPKLIDDYILISGSLGWNQKEILKEELFKDFKNSTSLKQLFLSYGAAETKLTTIPNDKFNTIIKKLERKNLNYYMKVYEKANHHSILSRAIYDGLLYIYKKK